MKNLKISLCYHPATIVFVDDNEDYLQMLEGFFKEVFPCVTFSDPHKAFQYLQESASEETSFPSQYIKHSQDPEYNEVSGGVEVRDIQNETLNPNRFKRVAVLIADYSMPSMDGAELCRAVENLNIQKLLLTGNADADTAVEAFNQGIIDKFLRKGNIDTVNVLSKEINGLILQYFLNLSEPMLHRAREGFLEILYNQKISDLFAEICEKNNIVEYYLISDLGDFLCLDKDGGFSRFSVKSKTDLDNLYQYALLDESLSKDQFQALKKYKEVPFFDSIEQMDSIPADDWKEFFCPLKKVSDGGEYFYCYKTLDKPIKALAGFTSYSDYLKKV